MTARYVKGLMNNKLSSEAQQDESREVPGMRSRSRSTCCSSDPKVKSKLPRFGGFARRPSRHIQTNLKAVYDRGAGRMLVMCKLDSALVSI